MKKIICSLLTLSLTQIVFAYDQKDKTDPLCSNEAKLTYFWNKVENICQSKFELKDAKISVTNIDGVFVIKTDQGETVNAVYKKNYKSLDERYNLKDCNADLPSCFSKSENGEKNENRLQVHNKQNLEVFPTKDRSSSDLAFKINFGEIKCQIGSDTSVSRLIIKDPTNKTIAALASDSFKIEESNINTEDNCKKLNEKNKKPVADSKNTVPSKSRNSSPGINQ